jgi:2'-5' RNA ligase
MTPTETALIVAISEAEAAVAGHRARLDRAAAWGVPAHVTVLYPFLPPDRIDYAVLAELSDAAAAVPRFAVTFARIGWFGEHVAYLAPEPDGPFRDLTAQVWQRFPDAPPYRGEFDDVVPHLTIGHDHPVPDLTFAAEEVAAHLPIRANVTAVRLIAGASGVTPWRALAEFPLGDRPA